MHLIQEEIGLPKISSKKVDDFTSIVEIGPLPAGYGMTLGNALRRVLISSLPGTAIVGVKIEGVAHEYTAMNGVKDSVLDILLNLKGLKLNKTTSEPSVLTLSASKTGEVTAKQIKTPSDVEVLNPELYISTLGSKGKLNMEIFVEKGVGHSLASQRNTDEDPQVIWIDAAYSPVRTVRYNVEDARVGQMTNLDKLVMHVETDGSIDAEGAVKFGANVLKSYFDLFNMSEVPMEAEYMSDVESIVTKQKEEEANKPAQEAYTPIEILGLSPRTLNSLINGGIGSIEQLVKCTESKLTNLRGFGKKALNEVRAALETRDLDLTEDN